MNKEIKFRAWDKNRKSMIDWFTMSQSTWNKGVTTLMYDILVSNKMNFDLMQYTGLKDKNGKEIYEGDIYKNCQLTGLCQVFFYGGAFCAGPNIIDSTPLCWDIQGDDLGIDNFNIEIEIIGNIYENPELLK